MVIVDSVDLVVLEDSVVLVALEDLVVLEAEFMVEDVDHHRLEDVAHPLVVLHQD